MTEIAPNGHTDEPLPNEEQEENANGWRAFTTLGQYLTDDGWYPQQLENKTIYRMYYKGDNGELRCYAQIRVELEQFLFYAIAPVNAPEESRTNVAEYLTRANYGLRIGNFEMDYSDGEIRYKSSLDFEDEALTSNLIRNTIYPAVQTMDRYLAGLMRVMYNAQTPEEAIGDIES
ncbi:MAG: YbjN domain-containing protein [Anaerolineae bacterium]|nr:YbjN domain-containing protein [Anaerolineae bacterium]